jgi:hypothetical protein
LTVDTGELDQLMVLSEAPESISVLTGAQWGPMEVCVADLTTAPAVGDEWEEVIEFSVSTPDGLGVAELFGEPRLTITERTGPFRVRLCCRGRAAGAARRSSGPRSKVLEHYLIEVWPAPFAPPEVLRAIEAPPSPAPVVLACEAAGREAAGRIDRDLRRAAGARTLSGERGSVRVSYEFQATRRKLFAQCDPNVLDGWVTNFDDDEIVDDHGLSPRLAIHGGGRIFCTETEAVRPRSRTMTWDWRIPAHPRQLVWADYPSFLDPPPTVRFDLVERKDQHGLSRTTITVEHNGLPIEWLEDMTAFWHWRLERGDRLCNLGHY